MNNRALAKGLMVLCLLALGGCRSRNEDIEVYLMEGNNFGQAYEVVSKADQITIIEISFNRGNCVGTYNSGKVQIDAGIMGLFGQASTKSMSEKLRFGESFRGFAQCAIREMQVETEDAVYTFEF